MGRKNGEFIEKSAEPAWGWNLAKVASAASRRRATNLLFFQSDQKPRREQRGNPAQDAIEHLQRWQQTPRIKLRPADIRERAILWRWIRLAERGIATADQHVFAPR